MKYIRFDIKSERSARLQKDKFALISDVWNKFMQNRLCCYKPGENITVDEQLFPSKVRCRFLQYIANKPDKFGIKFWLCVDVDSKYVLNGLPYLGKDDSRPQNQSLGENVVMRLLEPFLNTGRNITTDNFVTSVSLAKNLLSKRPTIEGTMSRARREIPSYAKSLRLSLFETKILKYDRCTLTIYQGKRNKNVLLLSTLHGNVDIDANHPKKKRETVTFCNATKFGVDVADQMAKKYSVKAASRRWPVKAFFNILDLAGINSYVLYKTLSGKNIKRRKFILNLAGELSRTAVTDEVSGSEPLSTEPLPSTSSPSLPVIQENRKRRECYISKCKNKTNKFCDHCKKPLCGSCNLNKSLKCKNCM